jgi:hypothetical protein
VPEGIDAARDAVIALVAGRAPEATVCPSEVARALATTADAWRDAMPAVHAAVDRLVAKGVVGLSWKGVPLAVRAGPYRIRRVLPDTR